MALVAPEWSRSRVRNHDEKTKDMGRSVLASKHRQAAKYFRRRARKRQRTHELAATTEYQRAAYRGAIDPDDLTPDLHGTTKWDIWWMVEDRRFYDKLGPLLRWAKATIAADPALRSASVEEQVAYFRRLMPDTLAGRHAVSHIRSELEYPVLYAALNEPPVTPDLSKQPAEIERLARLILAAGLHGTLNARLRRAAREAERDPRARPVPYRMLLGSHDVAAFAADMAGSAVALQIVAEVAVRYPLG
jgi:hypothetical protein